MHSTTYTYNPVMCVYSSDIVSIQRGKLGIQYETDNAYYAVLYWHRDDSKHDGIHNGYYGTLYVLQGSKQGMYNVWCETSGMCVLQDSNGNNTEISMHNILLRDARQVLRRIVNRL